MDRISHLSDDLLLKILSFLPTNDVVPTMVLSKRWKPLWKLVPELKYEDTNLSTEYSRFYGFVQRSLFLNEAPVIESLCFTLGPRCTALDLNIWVKLSVTRCLRTLDIIRSHDLEPMRVPESLYTCKTVESLHLGGPFLVDAADSVCLPSLSLLILVGVIYSDDESVNRLLSGCPILKWFLVARIKEDNVVFFTVKSPSLLGLIIFTVIEELLNNNHGVVIDAPSLKALTITDHSGGFCLLDNIPMVRDADIDIVNNISDKILGSLTSVKNLQLCFLIPKPAYPKGTIFHKLKRLELCTCQDEWLDLLMSLLRDSPKLRVLELTLNHKVPSRRPPICWNQPSSVPECFTLDLETFEWSSYKGTPEEIELVKFVLKNGKSLKTVIITPKATTLKQKFQMMKELTLSSRVSPTCELVFN